MSDCACVSQERKYTSKQHQREKNKYMIAAYIKTKNKKMDRNHDKSWVNLSSECAQNRSWLNNDLKSLFGFPTVLS